LLNHTHETQGYLFHDALNRNGKNHQTNEHH
jgi:hypothetical protein